MREENEMAKNTETKKQFRFLLNFDDGRTEEVAVTAGSFSAAVIGLPRFAEVGKYKYKLLNR